MCVPYRYLPGAVSARAASALAHPVPTIVAVDGYVQPSPVGEILFQHEDVTCCYAFVTGSPAYVVVALRRLSDLPQRPGGSHTPSELP